MREHDAITGSGTSDLMVMAAGKCTPAVMTHISRGKWHMTKVNLVYADSNAIHLEIPQKDHHHPVNIRVDQPVGLSFKHDYCKYICDSVVTGFEPSTNMDSGGVIVIASPQRVDRLQRRNFYRVTVPLNLNVRALFWHRGYKDETNSMPEENYWQGRLIDLSAGGMQIGIDPMIRSNFSQGQIVGLQFTPMPYEKPILLECQIRHIAPTVDGAMICLGLQIVGLEATAEGRETLMGLCEVVKTYYNMNHDAGIAQAADALCELE
ncbi:MAG: hypothetical protein A2Y07_11300 [Planctomycetes bacterium GWF2_50_10]|nr:MAG: hypothetical protein A2Y07_11300 [Planctomycetes bacterium GWF2_50_10]